MRHVSDKNEGFLGAKQYPPGTFTSSSRVRGNVTVAMRFVRAHYGPLHALECIDFKKIVFQPFSGKLPVVQEEPSTRLRPLPDLTAS